MRYQLLPLLLVCTLGSAPVALAQVQVSLGPRVGENLATRHSPDVAHNPGYRFGLVAGAQASLSKGKFALQPALLFSQKGSSDSQEVTSYPNGGPPQTGDYTIRFRLNYLTLPLNFVFAPAGTGTGPQVFAGPYASMLLGGTISESFAGKEVGSYPISVGSEEDPISGTFAVRRFDAGLQGGVGFRFERLLLQAEYSLGLRNQFPTYSTNPLVPNTTAYNRSFQASVSYLFDLTH